MDEQLKTNLSSSKQWFRLFYMILMAACLYIAGLLIWIVVPIQALFALICGEPNINLRRFGQSLSAYFFQILSFLTYNSEEKPFPFSDWPTPEEYYDDDEEVLEGEVEVAHDDYEESEEYDEDEVEALDVEDAVQEVDVQEEDEPQDNIEEKAPDNIQDNSSDAEVETEK